MATLSAQRTYLQIALVSAYEAKVDISKGDPDDHLEPEPTISDQCDVRFPARFFLADPAAQGICVAIFKRNERGPRPTRHRSPNPRSLLSSEAAAPRRYCFQRKTECFPGQRRWPPPRQPSRQRYRAPWRGSLQSPSEACPCRRSGPTAGSRQSMDGW